MRTEISYTDASLKKLSPLTAAEIRVCLNATAKVMATFDEYEAVRADLGRVKSVALLFCDDEYMRSVQRRFRKLDRTTDILSFPTLELPAVQRLAAEGSLGDLLVSLPAIERGARRGRRTARLELLDVLVHGMLHLIGMDHVQGGVRAKRMRQVQRQLFLSLKKSI